MRKLDYVPRKLTGEHDPRNRNGLRASRQSRWDARSAWGGGGKYSQPIAVDDGSAARRETAYPGEIVRGRFGTSEV